MSPGFAKALLHARDSHMAKLLRSEPFAFDRLGCQGGAPERGLAKATDPGRSRVNFLVYFVCFFVLFCLYCFVLFGLFGFVWLVLFCLVGFVWFGLVV